MSTEQVKQTLANEAQLLESMIEYVNAFPNDGFTKEAKFIQGSWSRFLDDRRKTNRALIEAGKKNLLVDLTGELDQVNAYMGRTFIHPDYTELWEKFLKCEADILQHLIDMCDKEDAGESK